MIYREIVNHIDSDSIKCVCFCRHVDKIMQNLLDFVGVHVVKYSGQVIAPPDKKKPLGFVFCLYRHCGAIAGKRNLEAFLRLGSKQ